MLLFVSFGGVALAKPKVDAAADARAADTASKVLAEEYASADFKAASKRIAEATALCDRKGCRPETRARLQIVEGMIASQRGDPLGAKEKFAAALKLSPAADLPERGITPGIKIQWAEARGPGAAPAPPSNNAALAASGVLPAGWKSRDAFRLAMDATDAKEAADYKLCVQKDEESLGLEDQPRTRLHLSSCLYRSGALKASLREAQKALDAGMARHDVELMARGRERVKQLVELTPRVTFQAPNGVEDLKVQFDTKPVAAEALGKKFIVDPGPHEVTATGLVSGFPSEFKENGRGQGKGLGRRRHQAHAEGRPDHQAADRMHVSCKNSGRGAEVPSPKTPCAGRPTSAPTWPRTATRTACSWSAPGINAAVASPTAGWNVAGNFLVDVVSAASPDIVSYASPPFRERRYAGGLSGGYKLGAVTAQANGSVSSEPDYLSRTIGGAVLAELADKSIVPRLGLNYTNDTIGRGPFRLCKSIVTDYTGHNPCRRPFTILAPELAVTMILSPASLLQIGATVQFESGDQSKPYRYVPMFDKANVDKSVCAAITAPHRTNTCVKPGQPIDTVDQARLALRPNEQLPTSRQRYALAARYNRRIANSMTLRLEERIYHDTWNISASTTDVRYLVDLGKRFRIWPHGRFHAQTAANFYRLAYVSTVTADTGAPVVPTYRTTDRELQSMLQVTGGGGAHLDLGNPDGEIRPGLTFTADVLYSYYFASLFLRRANRHLRHARLRRGLLMMRRPRLRLSGLALALALGLGVTAGASSCTLDPVAAAQQAAYEDEPDLGLDGKAPNTEFHRPGQDCLACHGPRGSAKNKFLVAGTVFWGTCLDPEAGPEKCKRVGVDRAEVRIVSQQGSPHCIHTNCVGNFYVREGFWGRGSKLAKPAYPLLASVRKVSAEGAAYEQIMSGHINRWGSCNECHRTSPYWNSAGQIYLTAANGDIPASADVEAAACVDDHPATNDLEPQCAVLE